MRLLVTNCSHLATKRYIACQTCGMADSHARQTAPELLAIPVITDDDVLDRVAAIV